MKNTVQYISTPLIKNKTSFHIYEEIPINAAKAENKLPLYLHYIIQTVLLCNFKLVFTLSPSPNILLGLESLCVVMKQQHSSSEQFTCIHCFTACEQDAHKHLHGNSVPRTIHGETTTLHFQKCLHAVHNTQGCMQCHVAVEAQTND